MVTHELTKDELVRRSVRKEINGKVQDLERRIMLIIQDMKREQKYSLDSVHSRCTENQKALNFLTEKFISWVVDQEKLRKGEKND